MNIMSTIKADNEEQKVCRLSDASYETICAFRHHMHEHPELSHQEFQTTKAIRAFLETLPGIELVDLPRGNTGCLAILQGERTGKGEVDIKLPEVLLRADIDAIPQTEDNDLPWKSKASGLMHGCGHDFHTAALLGAALILSERREEFAGQVDFLFQKAEETTDGAPQMIEEGLFEVISPDMVFGEHNRPEADVGQIIVKEGPLMAGKINLAITIFGKSGHGSVPHLTVDPIPAAAALILALQTVVSRNTDPLDSVVLTVGSVHSGTPANLTVDRAELTVTIRSLQAQALKHAYERLVTLTEQTALAYGCRSEICIDEEVPPVVNSPEMTKLARAAAQKTVGPEKVVITSHSLASEDFAFYMQKIPGFFYWIGSGAPGQERRPWHDARFQADDRGMKTAAEVLAQSAMDYLTARE